MLGVISFPYFMKMILFMMMDMRNSNYGSAGSWKIRVIGDKTSDQLKYLPPIDFGPGRTVIAISTGRNHVCAILDDGSTRCWGYLFPPNASFNFVNIFDLRNNVYGQLGLGNTESRGDDPNEMGEALPEVDLGTDRTAVFIACGEYSNCAILDNGETKCWGYVVFF